MGVRAHGVNFSFVIHKYVYKVLKLHCNEVLDVCQVNWFLVYNFNFKHNSGISISHELTSKLLSRRSVYVSNCCRVFQAITI